jgi:hypothetical protein
MAAFRFFATLALVSAASAQSPDQLEYFEKNVRPVLVANCQPCHNLRLKSSGLDLSTAAGLLTGGAGGAVIAKQQPEKSRILGVIGYEESLKMPPTGKLKPEQIEAITNWVKMGAPWPGADRAAAVLPTPVKKEFTPAQKAYWAFQPIKDNALPEVKDAQWGRTSLDRFVLAKLEAKGLKAAPSASKLALLRRATFDLTGLPPSEKEIGEFLADSSPDAFAKVVDRLLASPRYGERWGRHWLDVARYADSTGNDEDHRYPYAWRYRDYVIDAFNQDLPYDQFVREQVAGDLLPSAGFNQRGIVATGFLALGAKALAQVDKKKMLYDVWDEQVDVTSRAFLGLTMACARCHDHKFDPILTKDYYSMVGMFASTRSFKKTSQGDASLLYRPLVPKEQYAAWQAKEVKIAIQKLELEHLTDSAFAPKDSANATQLAAYMLAARSVYQDHANAAEVARQKNFDPALLAKWVTFLTPPAAGDVRDLKPYLDEWHKATAETAPAVAAGYQKRYEASIADWQKDVEKAYSSSLKKLNAGEMARDRAKSDEKDPFFRAAYLSKGPYSFSQEAREKLLPAETQLQIAAFRTKSAEIQKNGPAEPDMADAVDEDAPVQQKVLLRGDYHNEGEDAPRAVPAILRQAAPPPAEFHGSGRLEVAQWLARTDNPLPARVMANRIWMWHFGEGIVATPDNFGRMGGRPTNPELLDYLASRFIESGWSIKKLHRLIMLSNTYQMSTDTDTKTMEADPENLLMSRFNRQRLDVEQLRDGMLAIDGTIDLTMHGTLQSGFGTDSENSSGRLSLNPETVKRRTVYLPLRRSNLPSLLNLFDFGDATTVNGKRALTNVAPQALFMMNSEFVLERAKNLASGVLKQTQLSDRQRVDELYLQVLDRRPAAEEADKAFTFMTRYQEQFHTSPEAAWQSFCHVLLTSNEFLYLE